LWQNLEGRWVLCVNDGTDRVKNRIFYNGIKFYINQMPLMTILAEDEKFGLAEKAKSSDLLQIKSVKKSPSKEVNVGINCSNWV